MLCWTDIGGRSVADPKIQAQAEALAQGVVGHPCYCKGEFECPNCPQRLASILAAALQQARQDGATWMLASIRGGLQNYPSAGLDIGVADAVTRLLERARQQGCPACPHCHLKRGGMLRARGSRAQEEK
jgi:hypothetical protein